jgi:hypothetical protein
MLAKFWMSAATVALLSATGAGVATAQDGDQPGDASTTATIALGEPIAGAFAPAGDADWFRLQVEAGQRYAIALDGVPDAEGGAADPVVSVYSASGEHLDSNDDSNGTLNSLLQFTPAQSGEVFVEAREFGDGTGAYQLTVTASPLPADDVGNDASTRARAATGRDIGGVIEYTGDVDWYRLNARSGRRYTITATSAGESGLQDPFLRVMTADGETLALNDDAGDGTLNSLVEFAPGSNGPVYVEVRAFADAYEGAYTLRIDEARAPRDGVAAATNTRGRIREGDSVSGVLDFVGDHDWYRIRLTEGESYRFRLSGGDGEGALADPMLRVHGSDGAELALDDDGGGGLNSLVEFTAPSTDNFYVDAGAFADSGVGTYTLTAIAGDIPADASTDVTLSADGDYRDGVLSPSGDRDWYRVDLTEGQIFRVSLVGQPSGVGALDDPYLAIHGPNGEALAADDDGGEGLNSLLEFQAGPEGPYYIEVRGFSEDAQGGYSLALAGGEIGSTPDTADAVSANGEGRSSVISATDDTDWFAIELVEARPYRFSVDGVGPDALADPLLMLYDEEGKAVAEDDDGGAGLNAYLYFASPTGGRYYLGVSGYEGATGSYFLRATDTEVPGNFGTDEYLDANGDDRISAIELPGETDFYIVTLEGGVRYTIDVRPFGSSPMSDPAITLLSETTEEVGADDDSGPGRSARLRYTPEQPGSFAIQVRGVNGSNGGYQVQISRE